MLTNNLIDNGGSENQCGLKTHVCFGNHQEANDFKGETSFMILSRNLIKNSFLFFLLELIHEIHSEKLMKILICSKCDIIELNKREY